MSDRAPPEIRWAVAKYMPDLTRKEPRNIGVVLATGNAIAAKFAGERADGVIDGRSVPRFVNSLANYREWIRYWRSRIDSASSFDALPLGRTTAANYYLERSGRVLFGEFDPSSFIETLFVQLVVPNDPSQPVAEEKRPAEVRRAG